jgi:hypothetical protein
MKRSIYLAAVIFCLTGCMKLKPKDKDNESHDATDVEMTAAVRPSKVSYTVLETSEAHQYKVQFNFKEPVSTVALRKTVNEKQTVEWIAVRDQVWVDHNVPPGELIKYEFGQITQEKFEKWDEVALRGPQDLIIDKAMSLTDEKVLSLFSASNNTFILDRYYKIYFTKEAVLNLSGKTVKILAHEIYSEGGLIQTFPEGTTAGEGQNGRPGGLVEINVNKAVGLLTVELRGENGGRGLPGPKPDSRLKGPKGNKGIDAVMSGPPPMVGVNDTPVNLGTCNSQPTNGGDGGKGSPGYQGGTGMRGGSSGKLVLRVKDSSEFDLKDSKFAGVGGLGGFGGEGGEGGDPGEAGNPSSGAFTNCTFARNGRPGLKGDNGPQGNTGPSGEIEKTCDLIKNSCY